MCGSQLKLNSSSLRCWSPNTGTGSAETFWIPYQPIEQALDVWGCYQGSLPLLASTSQTSVCTLASHHPTSVCVLTSTKLLVSRVVLLLAPVPRCMAFSSVRIVLALAVCFWACSSLTKHGCLQANVCSVSDVSNKGSKCAM